MAFGRYAMTLALASFPPPAVGLLVERRFSPRRHGCGWLVSGVAMWAFGVSQAAAAERPSTAVDFARDIRPVLHKHCVKCHGDEERNGGLRLDRQADAMRR